MEITIRRATPGDAEALRNVFAGPRARAGTLQLPYPSAEKWRKYLEEPPEGTYSLVACLGDADGEVVGELGLETTSRPRLRHAGSIGVAVRDDWQGKGVGSELMRAALDLADNWLELTRVELTVFADNAAGIALYEKFGFEKEGTHRRYAFRDGGYVNALTMARLKDQ